ncbi:MAG: pilus assembly protein PilM [Candidatus Wallbacteria bacterium]|nr:pilus assembly protein PilM [Candidatus Wallbacteria bacterium]
MTGLDFGHSRIKLLQVRKKKTAPTLEKAFVFPAPAAGPEGVSAQALSDALSGAFKASGIKPKNLVISVGSPHYSILRLELPPTDPVETQEAIRWNIEALLPFPIDRALMDHRVVPAEAGDPPTKLTTRLVVAVDRDAVSFHLDVLDRMGLKAQRAQVGPVALLEAYRNVYPVTPKQTIALIDIGHLGTGMTLVTGGRLRLHRVAPVGGSHLISAFAREQQLDEPEALRKFSTFQSATPLSRPLQTLAARVERFFQYFEDLNPTEQVAGIYLCGAAATVPGLPEQLSETFRETVQLFDPIARSGQTTAPADPRVLGAPTSALAVCWGLVV